ncbi:hypothetical protein DUI87_32859 [Hirundo rustica rustica]|uniref:Uncharacterized protein n=1 Tax=Hirundo rustica rustica TaxID=333673 RepID=A0A3M0IPK6_HIRRU|nr:hypothetical protein DUI87_32859 [Hirundo rustica rustica]
MPGIHLDVWGTTWLCEKAREGSRLPPEVRLVCKLASKAKGILHPESTRWRCQPPPFLPPQPVSLVGQVALQQVACLELSLRAELGRRYLLKEEKSSKTCDSSIRQQRAQSTRKESSLQEPWLLTVRLSSSAVLVRQNLSVVL